MRPGASSVGPRSAARKADPLVEPATFQAAIPPKPISPVVPATQQVTIEPAPALAKPASESPSAPALFEQSASKPIPQNPAPIATPGRRLNSGPTSPEPKEQKASLSQNPLEGLFKWRPSSQQLTATGGGLAIAVGLLLSTIWLLRSCAPKSSRPLPRDVVEVLGRAPLGAKQTTQLVRVGNKLVLVAITPEGAKTLTEITDPGEVQRLIAACDSNNGRGSTADFDQMLQQMASEPAERGFLGSTDQPQNEDSRFGFADAAFDPRSLAAAYANTPGGRGDG